MAQLLADKRDQDFVIWEQMGGEAFLRSGPFSGYDRKMCDMILTEARALAVKEVLPTLAEGDREGLHFENGVVKVPECFHRPFELILEGGWNNLGVSEEMGGQGALYGLELCLVHLLRHGQWHGRHDPQVRNP